MSAAGRPAAESARVAVMGGGPAGLMAAQTLAEQGIGVDVYDAMRSVGRKFLLAGVGGLNLTHAEPSAAFRQRYPGRVEPVGRWLDVLDADGVRAWAATLGIATFVGSSQRVFPAEFKAAPLLRAWLRQLRGAGVRIHPQHRWLGFGEGQSLRMRGPDGEFERRPAATVLALGGASWPQLGSDGSWLPWLHDAGVAVAPLRPANCGFELDWSPHLRAHFAGQPLKPVLLRYHDATGGEHIQQGELMVTVQGLEGGLLYAHSARLRDRIDADGSARIELDLVPGRSLESLQAALDQPRGNLSWSSWLRRRAGLDGLRVALLHEAGGRPGDSDPLALATRIKRLPLTLLATRPIAEAISSAGGVRFDALDANQMLKALPGVFCAGEMLDWEAATGGYLLTACLASGRATGQGVNDWLRSGCARDPDPAS